MRGRLAAEVRVLTQWMCQDVLALAGPGLAKRQKRYDFVIAELEQLKEGCSHRIGPVVRMFLNHRPFLRSDRPERKGKSPTELLTGQSHPHWLEMLGYTRFHGN